MQQPAAAPRPPGAPPKAKRDNNKTYNNEEKNAFASFFKKPQAKKKPGRPKTKRDDAASPVAMDHFVLHPAHLKGHHDDQLAHLIRHRNTFYPGENPARPGQKDEIGPTR